MAALEETGQTEKTLVVFTSDQGYRAYFLTFLGVPLPCRQV